MDWAAWHLPDGPVGLAARWAATTNVEVGQTDRLKVLARDLKTHLSPSDIRDMSALEVSPFHGIARYTNRHLLH